MALTISSVSPASGNLGGGETVAITGTDLNTVTSVEFETVPATSFTIENAFLIHAVVPRGAAAGPADVTVDDGVAPVTLTDGYTYSAVDSTEQLVSTLARKWKLDINTGTVAVPVWTPVRAIGELKPTLESNMEDDSDYDSDGWASETRTQLKWSLEVKVLRKIGVTSDNYDPGQEALRIAAEAFGSAGTPQLRWYDRDGGPEAYSGFGSVSWEPEGGEAKDLDTVTIKIAGNGKRTSITNPAAA